MKVRRYGASGPLVVALHGGPAAPGHMAGLARALADRFRVLEPWQRGSGDVPLTVDRHVADLHDLLESEAIPPGRGALLGFSWGAMLALAYASAHPAARLPIVLVGCGTFDLRSRERMRAILDARTDEALRTRLARVSAEIPDENARRLAQAELTLPLYSHDLLTHETGTELFDARAHQETWDDALRLQEEGLHPAAFAAIDAPVLMLHGSEDPHPGRMIADSLAPHVRRLEYRELDACGHYPWLERAAREEFLTVLRAWLGYHLR